MIRAPSMNEVAAAQLRLADMVYKTPVLELGAVADEFGSRAVFKCEQFQVTGAFKARGATNAVRSLSPAQLARGVATHSSGNHGAALAWAAHKVDTQAWIVMPENAVASKCAAIRRYGAKIISSGVTQAERERRLQEVVEETGAIVVHPFDDARVIAGQATATVELLDAAPQLTRLLVPVGGGGLAAGAILAARLLGREIDIIGVEPSGADDTRRSLKAGHRVALPSINTVADGLQAQVGVATFPVLQQGLADLVTVSDEEILAAVTWAVKTAKLVIEPSAATVIAALMTGAVRPSATLTGAILSGGNLDFHGEAWRRASPGAATE